MPDIVIEYLTVRPGIWVTLPGSGLDVLMHPTPNQRPTRLRRLMDAEKFGGWDVSSIYDNATWRKTRPEETAISSWEGAGSEASPVQEQTL
jgi:hypothetical protein